MGQEARLDHIANNLANVSTIGFKQDRAIFDDLMKMALQGLDSSETSGAGAPAIPAYTHGYTDFSVGPMIPTGSPLDLFIEGEGFFEIEGPSKEERFYTRAGNFTMNDAGELVTIDGRKVLDGSGIVVTLDPGAGKPTIQPHGEIEVNGKSIGTIQVVRFDDTSVLTKQGNGLFKAPLDVSPRPDRDALIRQGYVEGSNVRPIDEMIRMIETQRAFEAQQKAMQTIDAVVGQRITQILNS